MKKADLQRINFNSKCEFKHSAKTISETLDFPGVDNEGEVEYWDELHDIFVDAWNESADIGHAFENLISRFNEFIGMKHNVITIKEVMLAFLAFRLGETVEMNKLQKELKAIVAALMN